MGLIDRIKGMFGSGGSRRSQDSGIYLYVKLDRGDEIVRLRLEPQYELVPDYDQGGYVSHKSVVGPRTYQRAQATFRFNEEKSLVDSELVGGQMSDEAAWQAQEFPAETET